MNFIFMGFERKGEWHQLPQAEQQRRMGKHQEGLVRLTTQRSAAGRRHLAMSVGLHYTEESTIVRLTGGRHSVTDGPFTESKEVLAGFDIIDFDSKDEAVEWYKSLGFEHATHIEEIRPVANAALIYHGHRPTGASKFLLQFGNAPDATAAEAERIFRAAERITSEYVRKGFMDQSICWAGARLAPPREAITLRNVGGRTVASDGPFAEAREVIGGFTILDCDTKEETLECARKYSFVEGDVTEVIPCGFWWTQLV